MTAPQPSGSAELATVGLVEAVHASGEHTMSKRPRDSIGLLAGLGVRGDAHMGATVKHRSRVQRDPTQPNLRQVHLIHAELHDELRGQGFDVAAGAMGENITTRGIELLGLPTGARLHIGHGAVIEVTGLRNPCGQLNGVAEGLMAACVSRGDDGELVRKAGVMGVVVTSGEVRAGDAIRVELPSAPYLKLQPV